jgi:predicted transposase YdaD
MSKPFDATLKDLIEQYPADWLPLAGLRTSAPVEVIDADVSTVSGAADRVLQIREASPWLLHLELQVSRKQELDEGLHWYNALVRHRHGRRVRTVVVLMRPEADSPSLTGVYREQFPDESPYLEFRYQVVRVWQVPAETLLTSGLGLLPLAPLGTVAESALPGVIQRMKERLDHEAPPERAAVLWTATYVLMGLHYEEALTAQLLQGVRGMQESVTYQAILREGRAEGRVEGRAEGARTVLLRQGTRRFGVPDTATTQALEAITDLERLERMADRVHEVASWAELLATE